MVADFVTEDGDTAVYVAALVALPPPEDGALDRHLIRLNKATGAVLSTKPVSIEPDEMKQLLLNSDLGTLLASTRLNSGSYGMIYKVAIQEPDRPQLVVQLRFQGNVASMNVL